MATNSFFIDCILGFKESQIVFTASQLGIFDALKKKPSTLHDLASNVANGHIQAEVLERLLRACICLGLISKDQETYVNTPTTEEYLPFQAHNTLGGLIGLHSKCYKAFDTLETCIQQGKPKEHGSTGFDLFYGDEQYALQFSKAMHSFAHVCAPQVLSLFDLSEYKTAVDLGGGTGALMSAACEMYPGMSANIIDLPNVVYLANKYFSNNPNIIPETVKDRLTWSSVDIFNEPEKLPQGDLFVLSRILHDWDDESCNTVLKNVYSILPEKGALLVCESILDEDGMGPWFTLVSSITMFLLLPGKERSLTEYQKMLQAAGFSVVRGKTSGAYLDAILAIKE